MPGLVTEKCYVCHIGGWRKRMKKDGEFGALILWRHDFCEKDAELVGYYERRKDSHYRNQAEA